MSTLVLGNARFSSSTHNQKYLEKAHIWAFFSIIKTSFATSYPHANSRYIQCGWNGKREHDSSFNRAICASVQFHAKPTPHEHDFFIRFWRLSFQVLAGNWAGRFWWLTDSNSKTLSKASSLEEWWVMMFFFFLWVHFWRRCMGWERGEKGGWWVGELLWREKDETREWHISWCICMG